MPLRTFNEWNQINEGLDATKISTYIADATDEVDSVQQEYPDLAPRMARIREKLEAVFTLLIQGGMA